MKQYASLLILLGAVVAIGILFFGVIRPFLFPLFFAGVLAVLFHPLYSRLTKLMRGHRRIAAFLMTIGVILVVMIPLGGVLTIAGWQLFQTGQEIVAALDLPVNSDEAKRLVDPAEHPHLARAISWVEQQFKGDFREEFRQAASSTLMALTETVYERTKALASDLIALLIGIVIMFVSLYYFFADGDAMVAAARRMSPLETAEENQLVDQFQRVCRGVVMGTVVSALVQGILAAIIFWLLGIPRVWLLAVFTMFFSFIPFLGAASVWICVAIGLLIEQRFGAAVILTIYGAGLISSSDNLLKAYAIHGQVKMHPLVALVTVLGAVQLVGLWGIFVGPISAAFFYALLNILRQRMISADGPGPTPATN